MESKNNFNKTSFNKLKVHNPNIFSVQIFVTWLSSRQWEEMKRLQLHSTLRHIALYRAWSYSACAIWWRRAYARRHWGWAAHFKSFLTKSYLPVPPGKKTKRKNLKPISSVSLKNISKSFGVKWSEFLWAFENRQVLWNLQQQLYKVGMANSNIFTHTKKNLFNWILCRIQWLHKKKLRFQRVI